MTGHKKSGVPLVFKIMGALMVLMLVIVAAAVSFYRNCEDCPKYASMVFEGLGKIQAGMVAPGTNEMRALGCDEAMALEMEVFKEFIEPFEEEGEASVTDDAFFEATMVLCKQGSILAPDGPECHEVADAYISGAHPAADEELAVVVQGRNSQARYCGALYSGSGEFLQVLEE